MSSLNDELARLRADNARLCGLVASLRREGDCLAHTLSEILRQADAEGTDGYATIRELALEALEGR